MKNSEKIGRGRFVALIGFLLVLVAGATGGICSLVRRVLWQMGEEVSPLLREKFSKLPNYSGGVFRNSQPTTVNLKKGGFSPRLLRHLFASPNRPTTVVPQVALTKRDFASAPAEFSVRWLGHSTMIFELAGMRFITDPVFGNAAPIPFAVSRYCESPLSRQQLPKLDFVLITHDHYDHLEMATVEFLSRQQRDLKFVTMLGVGGHLKKWGVAPENVVELNWGESVALGRLKIRAVESRHFSGRSFGARDTTLWGAFIFEFETTNSAGATTTRKVFHGGDGGYGEHFKKIGDNYGGFDLVCLEIDAWNENWRGHHMFPQDAVKAFGELRGKVLLPMHWGVFDLAMHPWNESVGILAREAAAHGVAAAFPKMGELVSLAEPATPLPQAHWWE